MPFIYNPDAHQRHSIRLPNYDYAQPGYYFVTICSYHREHLFGDIKNGVMVLSEIGRIVDTCWNAIPDHFPHVQLDAWVIMPNHVHGMIEIMDGHEYDCDPHVGVQNFEPLPRTQQSHSFQHTIPQSLGSIIRGYKIGVTTRCRTNELEYMVWQRNFYDSIIRNKSHLNRVREYIQNNPRKWQEDIENLQYQSNLSDKNRLHLTKIEYDQLCRKESFLHQKPIHSN